MDKHEAAVLRGNATLQKYGLAHYQAIGRKGGQGGGGSVGRRWELPTHQAECKYGHPLTGDNLYAATNAKGYHIRQCKECWKLRKRAQRAGKRRDTSGN